MAVTTLRQVAVEELCWFIDEEGKDFPALAWIWQALRARGKLLAEEAGLSWGMLPLLVCAGAGGDSRAALPLAVAVECFIAAADTFDDVQDCDTPDGLWRACGLATATNVATFLLFLTQLALGRLARRLR